MPVPEHVNQTIAYWDLVPAIAGGLIGALAGGIPAWLLAKRQSDETLRRDLEERTQNQKALAFSVAVKLINIINSSLSLANHVKSCLANLSVPERSHMEPWQVVIPMIGFTDEGSIRFTSEEMAVFASAGDTDLMQDMILFSLRHSASLEVFNYYCQKRFEFQEIGPKPEGFDGQIAMGFLTQDEIFHFKKYTIPMNNMIVGLDSGFDQDLILARKVIDKFSIVTKRHFKVDNFISLHIPTDEEIAEMRKPQALG